MSLLFKHGPMTDDMISWIKRSLREYPYVLYLSELPNTDKFTVYSYGERSITGHTRTKRTQMWTCNRYREGTILMCKKPDYDTVLKDQPDIVIDAQPFQTLL